MAVDKANNTYSIDYLDGDKEEGVSIKNIRVENWSTPKKMSTSDEIRGYMCCVSGCKDVSFVQCLTPVCLLRVYSACGDQNIMKKFRALVALHNSSSHVYLVAISP